MEIIPSSWNDQVNTWLLGIKEIGYTLAELREDVEQGRAAVFEVHQEGDPSAALILSPVGEALEIWALAGRVGGMSGLHEMLAAVEMIAKALGLSAVWFKTARPGLVIWCQGCGYIIESQQGDIVRMKKCF